MSGWTIPASEIVFENLIARGGFGEVWKATWQGQGGGETVAVKKLPIQGANDAVIQEALQEVSI